ncbi:hypothetical protein K438DRAFT_1777747 [Mycena galopus ATCC 62051]|nr:hypothetical protein K438DRAFT_1777747 [Mycena galopus ATCC 62051]
MSASAHTHTALRGRVLTAKRAGREGTREKREPVVKVVRRSLSSESGDDGGPTLRRLSKGSAIRTKWPSSYRGSAEEALEDGKYVLELGGRSTKVRAIWNIIIEKLKTAGAETCPTHGGPGGMTVPAAPNVGALWWCNNNIIPTRGSATNCENVKRIGFLHPWRGQPYSADSTPGLLLEHDSEYFPMSVLRGKSLSATYLFVSGLNQSLPRFPHS